jgi:hypothetical protein
MDPQKPKKKKGEMLIWDVDGGGNEARMTSLNLSLMGYRGEEIEWV